ncbi:ricin-type beta-trefoil lectin domain protein [Streptomyces griseosporeus]|uniref:ricin-type beta-trefoil lectin domain protein n=1 Tax=Streptomyces griseosporeus TaxID=1910 RepID=UPI0037B2D615
MSSKTTIKVLAAVLAAVGVLEASGGTAVAFPDGQRVLIRNAATEQCVKAAPVPRSTDAPPYQLVLAECEPTDPAQRFYFSWDTLRSDALPGMCVTPVRHLAMQPCEESDHSQLWVSAPPSEHDPTDHIHPAQGKKTSWEARDGRVQVRPTQPSLAAQAWTYQPVG